MFHKKKKILISLTLKLTFYTKFEKWYGFEVDSVTDNQ